MCEKYDLLIRNAVIYEAGAKRVDTLRMVTHTGYLT